MDQRHHQNRTGAAGPRPTTRGSLGLFALIVGGVFAASFPVLAAGLAAGVVATVVGQRLLRRADDEASRRHRDPTVGERATERGVSPAGAAGGTSCNGPGRPQG